MEASIRRKIKQGIRYVVGYNTHDNLMFYLTKLSPSMEKVDKQALNMIKDKESLAEKLHLVKVEALTGIRADDGEVMLWTMSTNPSYFELEKIYEHFGHAKSVIRGTELQKHFFISPFKKEIVKTYKK